MSSINISIHDVEDLTFRRDKCKLTTGSFVHEIYITNKDGTTITLDLFTSNRNLTPKDITDETS